MSEPQADGHTLQEHLDAAERQTGISPPGLDGPDCPPEAWYLWEWYIALGNARGGNGFGLNPIGFTEIAAWSALTGCRPTPFEVGCLRALDDAFFRVREERERKKKP